MFVLEKEGVRAFLLGPFDEIKGGAPTRPATPLSHTHTLHTHVNEAESAAPTHFPYHYIHTHSRTTVQKVRDLSREQFFAVAHVNKIYRAQQGACHVMLYIYIIRMCVYMCVHGCPHLSFFLPAACQQDLRGAVGCVGLCVCPCMCMCVPPHPSLSLMHACTDATTRDITTTINRSGHCRGKGRRAAAAAVAAGGGATSAEGWFHGTGLVPGDPIAASVVK